MPIYDYACDKCGHRFEARQRFTDDPLTMCPECQGPIRRVIHPSGIIFKGSGWYITDSRKPDASPGSTPAKDTSSSDGAKSEKSESKSESTSTPSKAAADD